MSTQKLMLLFALVAVMGGCSIWYMKVILPNSITADDVTEVSMPNTPAKTAVKVEPAKSETKTAVVTPAAVTQGAAAAGTIDADIDAIAASANDSYDDTGLQTQITSSEPTLLSNAYGI